MGRISNNDIRVCTNNLSRLQTGPNIGFQTAFVFKSCPSVISMRVESLMLSCQDTSRGMCIQAPHTEEFFSTEIMEHFSRVPEKSQHRQLECNSSPLKNTQILHSAWNTECGKGFSLGVQTSFSLTAVLKHDWLTKPGPKHSNQLGRKCVSVRDIVCHMCVYSLFVCVYIPKGADLTLPWKCLNILVPNREVTVCKQEAGVCVSVVSLWFLYIFYFMCICVWWRRCSLNWHIFNHMVYSEEIVEKEGKGQISAALRATIGQARIIFFHLRVCTRTSVCVYVCAFADNALVANL